MTKQQKFFTLISSLLVLFSSSLFSYEIIIDKSLSLQERAETEDMLTPSVYENIATNIRL